jgi:hypothetical protein
MRPVTRSPLAKFARLAIRAPNKSLGSRPA